MLMEEILADNADADATYLIHTDNADAYLSLSELCFCAVNLQFKCTFRKQNGGCLRV